MKDKMATFRAEIFVAEAITVWTVYVGLSGYYHNAVIKLIEEKVKEIWNIHLNAINEMLQPHKDHCMWHREKLITAIEAYMSSYLTYQALMYNVTCSEIMHPPTKRKFLCEI